MGSSATGGARVQAAIRQEQAIQLRIGGATYREIARTIGVSFQQVQKMVARALDETRARTGPEIERLREIEARRMDGVIMSNWQQRGNPKNARAIIAASERRARLLGLDAPLRLEDATQRGDDGTATNAMNLAALTVEELREYERLLAKTRAAATVTIEAEVKEIGSGSTAPVNGVPKNGASGKEGA